MTMQLASANLQWKERADRVLMDTYGSRDITIVRGQGVEVWDADGNRYLDFLAGIAVMSLGHGHPVVREAIVAQLDRLAHISVNFLHEPEVELAEMLAAESGLSRVFYANSGAEAMETAMKIVRRWFNHHEKQPRRQTLLAFENSFHGRTIAALSATWEPTYRATFDPLFTNIRFLPFNDLAAVDAAWDDTVAAVLVESVQGNGGCRPATDEFLRGLRERCDRTGALLVADEVQAGLGRTGRSFGYQWSGIVPDVMACAKALGGGLSLSACLASEKFAHVLTKGTQGTTLGGSAIACAAGVASCRLLFDPELQREVGRLGCHLWGRLEELRARHPNLCSHVQGRGLMQALVLKKSSLPAAKYALRHGLIVSATAGTAIRLVPPLIVSMEQIDAAAEALGAALAEYERGG